MQKQNLLYILLLFALTFIAYPLMQETSETRILLNAFFSSIVIWLVLIVKQKKNDLMVALILGIVSFLLISASILTTVKPGDPLSHITFVATALFYGFGTITLFRFVITAKSVTSDILYGALCIYLLVGILWGVVYTFLEEHAIGSFQSNRMLTQADLLYYSFVTLLTIGYGDITPASNLSRSLSILEALVGVFYIAILISRLVGMHSTRGKSNE